MSVSVEYRVEKRKIFYLLNMNLFLSVYFFSFIYSLNPSMDGNKETCGVALLLKR